MWYAYLTRLVRFARSLGFLDLMETLTSGEVSGAGVLAVHT